MSDETVNESYERGHAAGVTAGDIAARLERHDDHFTRINGSLEKHVVVLEGIRTDVHRLTLVIQQLTSDAVNRDATVITTARALKQTVDTTATALEKADVARRLRSDTTWTPWQRLFAALGALAALATVVAVVVALRGR